MGIGQSILIVYGCAEVRALLGKSSKKQKRLNFEQSVDDVTEVPNFVPAAKIQSSRNPRIFFISDTSLIRPSLGLSLIRFRERLAS